MCFSRHSPTNQASLFLRVLAPYNNPGMELFFDRHPMTVSRYPHDGWLRVTELGGTRSFQYQDERPKAWKDLSDIWVRGFWQFEWADAFGKLALLSPDSHSATIRDSIPYPTIKHSRFVFMNVLEEVARPGEYFIDRRNSVVYFWPPSSPEGRESMVSVLAQPMFQIDGSHDVRIEGLELEGGRDGAVHIERSQHVVVDRCRIHNFGGYGVVVRNSQDSGVSGSVLCELGATGVELSSGDRKTLIPAHLFAEDDEIYNYSRWPRTYRPAVLVEGVGNRVSHCSLHDAPHVAVLLSGNDHLLEYNDVRRVCTETGDAGAFYMGRNTTMRGNLIRYNRFREIGPTLVAPGLDTDVVSVYLDDCFAGATIIGNLFEGPGFGVQLGGGRDTTIQGNVFLNCHPAITFDGRGMSWMKDSFNSQPPGEMYNGLIAVDVTKPPYSVRYPELKTAWTDDLRRPEGNKFIDNLCFGGKWVRYSDGLSEKSLKVYSGNVVEATGVLKEAIKRAPSHAVSRALPNIGPRRRP